MKEKERGKNETEKKRSEKKVPMRESNPRPLNLSVAIVSPRMCIYDQTLRIYIYHKSRLS